MRLVIPIFFHLLPLLPMVQGHYYFTVAAFLVVALPYIKSAKFTRAIQTLKESPKRHHPDTLREVESLEQIRRRWEVLTFLGLLPRP